MVVAGNSTLSLLDTYAHQVAVFRTYCDPSAARTFSLLIILAGRANSRCRDEDLYSYAEEKGLEVCWSIIIWDVTIHLDVETALNKLEVRGTPIAQHNANKTIGINANILDIKGGRHIWECYHPLRESTVTSRFTAICTSMEKNAMSC